MVVGRGMLANAFNTYENNDEVIIFASGVSNSQEKEMQAFDRELKLIQSTLSQNPNKLFVYFSTCSMYDPTQINTPYVQHKQTMEEYITRHAKSFLILRASQILGRSTNHTLANFLFDNILSGEHFHVWENSNRNLISIIDILNISHKLIENKNSYNQIYHLANQEYITMPELVKLYENILQKKANCTYVDKGQQYTPIPNDIDSVVQELNIKFDKQYYYHSIKKFITMLQGNKK